MKIGILTWHFAMNYGAKAHVSALYNVINSLGYEVEVVNYTPFKGLKTDLRACVSKNPLIMYKGLNHYIKVQEHNNTFHKGRIVAKNKISELYDIIILGSDEIFNVYSPCFDSVYMGVGLNSKKLFTYAVSCGQSFEVSLNHELKNSIRNIDFLYVRDRYTQQMIYENTNKSSAVVLDPTFLWDYTPNKNAVDLYDYILIYAFSPLDDMRDLLRAYADENKMKIVRICNYLSLGDWADKSIENPTMEEWYAYFKNASLVITDSYHGTIFSIKNRKQFVIYKKNDKESKIRGLLEELGIEKDYCMSTSSFEEAIGSIIDYDSVFELLEEKRERSINMIKEAITLKTGESIC